jgi:aspartate aminotransferase-like enzyme
MPMLAPVRVPDGVDDAAFRARLLETHGVEIMGAFGPLAGRVWRVGTMAGNARPAAVTRTLGAVADVLGDRARRALPEALRAAGSRFDADARAATLA